MMVGPTPANSLARHWARAPHPEAIPRRSPIRETSAAKAQPFRMRGGEVDSTAHATGSSRAEQRKALLLAKDPGAADAVELYIGPKVLLFPPPPRGRVRRYSRFLRARFTATDDRSCSSPPSSMQLVMQSRRGPAPPMSPGRSGWNVDDDALVENSIKNLDLAAGRAGSLDNHAALSSYADREITPTPCKAVATRG